MNETKNQIIDILNKSEVTDDVQLIEGIANAICNIFVEENYAVENYHLKKEIEHWKSECNFHRNCLIAWSKSVNESKK